METLKAARQKEIEAMQEKDEIEIEISQNIIADYKTELKMIAEKLDVLSEIEETTFSLESVEQYLENLVADAESSDPHVIKSLFDKLIEKVEVHDDKVVLKLIVNSFVLHRDSHPQGQPQFSLVTDIEKAKMRY